MAKNILVTGATGNQGGAVIDQLANNPNFTLLAVTRNTTSPSALKLQAKASNIKLVQGDQDDVPALFTQAAKVANGQIWGVYSVQVAIGKGITHEGEIRQGKSMIDEALKAGVKHFVYSSVDRGGDEQSWNDATSVPHFASKHNIELYLREKAATMSWTILRPVAFMDNFAPNFQSKVFLAALRDQLHDKPVQWVAVRDIGVFARLSFEDSAKFNHKAIGIAGDELNVKQISAAVKKATGQPLDGTFGLFGSLLRYMVTEIALMNDWFAKVGYGVNIADCRKINPDLLTFDAWLTTQKTAFSK